MSTFFEKYKKIRREQKIDLSDIENRTKINVKYFEAIESGNFEVIQQPYLRLFLKAYINEIGADPDIAIDELTEYLLRKDGGTSFNKQNIQTVVDEKAAVAEKPTESELETIPDNNIEQGNKEDKFQDISTTTTSIKNRKFNISPNLIKGILFIVIWVVIIIVIRNITLDTTPEIDQPNQNSIIGSISNYVDFTQLQSDYIELSSQQNAIEINPPYIVKIVTNNSLGIVSQQDTLNIESIPLAGGAQQALTFESKLDFILNHSNGVSAFINGVSISDIQSQEYPVRLTFSTDPKAVTIIHYSPTE